MVAAAGYIVLAPDTMAGPVGLRHRPPVADLASVLHRFPRDDFRWWCDDNVYAGGCANFDWPSGSPFCFSSRADEILHDPAAWASYYERVYEIRRRELQRVLRRLEADAASSFWQATKLFLVGESEGGMVVSRFYDAALHARLAGTVVLQWSCEHNYFVPCASDARLCEGRCSTASPFLAIIARRDPFFSAVNRDSIAATVARAAGYRISGDCFAGLAAQGMKHAASVVLPQQGLEEHGLTEAVPNLVRTLLAEFVAHPAQVSRLPLLRPDAQLCTQTGQTPAGNVTQWTCQEIGREPLEPLDELPCSTWHGVQTHQQYYAVGPREACAA